LSNRLHSLFFGCFMICIFINRSYGTKRFMCVCFSTQQMSLRDNVFQELQKELGSTYIKFEDELY
jgi:hypothetical protein